MFMRSTWIQFTQLKIWSLVNWAALVWVFFGVKGVITKLLDSTPLTWVDWLWFVGVVVLVFTHFMAMGIVAMREKLVTKFDQLHRYSLGSPLQGDPRDRVSVRWQGVNPRVLKVEGGGFSILDVLSAMATIQNETLKTRRPNENYALMASELDRGIFAVELVRDEETVKAETVREVLNMLRSLHISLRSYSSIQITPDDTFKFQTEDVLSEYDVKAVQEYAAKMYKSGCKVEQAGLDITIRFMDDDALTSEKEFEAFFGRLWRAVQRKAGAFGARLEDISVENSTSTVTLNFDSDSAVDEDEARAITRMMTSALTKEYGGTWTVDESILSSGRIVASYAP